MVETIEAEITSAVLLPDISINVPSNCLNILAVLTLKIARFN